MQRRHNATLDGLRGLAALSVAVMHIFGQTKLGAFPAQAYLAVDFFFVLSGFVIAAAYEDKRLTGRISLAGFLKQRAIRLMPLIVFGVTMGLASRTLGKITHGGIGYGYADLAAAFFWGVLLLPFGALPSDRQDYVPLDGPCWSLMFECLINLFYAVALKFLKTPVLLLLMAGSYAVLLEFAVPHGTMNAGYRTDTLYIGLARVIFSFFAGVVIFRWFTAGKLDAMPRIPAPWLGVVLVLSFLPKGFFFSGVYDALCVGLVYPLIVASGAFDAVRPALVAPALFLGRLSYPVYILHDPLIGHMTHLNHLVWWQVFFVASASFGVLFVVSYLSLRFYDEPVRRLLSAPPFAEPAIHATPH